MITWCSVSVTRVRCAKMVELIEVLFGLKIHRDFVLGGGPSPPTVWRGDVAKLVKLRVPSRKDRCIHHETERSGVV